MAAEHPTVEQLRQLREHGWLIVSTMRGICAKRHDHPDGLVPWAEALALDGEAEEQSS